MTFSLIPCPNCKVKGRVETSKNLLGEKIYILNCEECGSLSTSRDGIHWRILIQNNTNKEAKENE